jgi:TnpA family transposase
LPANLFAQVSAKTVDSYRNRIAVEELQEARRHPDPIRFTLPAAYCWRRRQEIVDTLVELLLDVTHHLSTKAERRVEKAFVKDIKKVSGKTNLLFRLAEAAVDKPDGTIREVVFPVVSEQTLRDLVKEYKAGGSGYQQQVQKAMRGPYSKHYRRMVPVILKHLAFCSNKEVHQTIIQALELLKKYVDVPLTQPYFASYETVPLDDIVPATWRKAVCIYSQLKRCSSSEVAAMITGLLRHASEMQVDRNYVDTHGQSEIGFAFCSLLGFQLLPRLKNLYAQKLYRPKTGHPDAHPNLQPVLTRPIKWELIRHHYDEMVKFATALRLGTAETEEILRRFTRNGVQHPTYTVLLELGKVQRTIFLCHYLSSEELSGEIQEGLNVVENWNSATNFIHFGRLREFSTNNVADQELAMLALHLLQIALTFIQTLIIQAVLSEPAWINRMTKENLRGLTPLIYCNVNPYGLMRPNTAERLTIERAEAV